MDPFKRATRPLGCLSPGHTECNCEKLLSDLNHCPRHRGVQIDASRHVKRRPDQLPDPWLFDSEKLLRELDRCRELMLLVPANGDRHATHFAVNLAIDAIWNLRDTLSFLLRLKGEGQRAFAKKHHDTNTGKRSIVTTTTLNKPARMDKK